jgi:hypothetical protein
MKVNLRKLNKDIIKSSIRFLLFGVAAFFLAACSVSQDVSNLPAFKAAIGKKFIAQQDLYIYSINGSSLDVIGASKDLDAAKSAGKQVVIKGIIKQGQTMVIKRILQVTGIRDSYTSYRVLIDQDPVYSKKECEITPVFNPDNPAKTVYWSDPPIFRADVANPAPDDGVWWK